MTPEESQLVTDIESTACDPLGFVKYAFPWGKGELEGQKIEPWQHDILEAIGKGLSVQQALQIAVASGHGLGKTAIVSWVILWALSTMEDSRGVVTANTATQLTTKTWPELAIWHRRFIARHWFTLTATAIYSSDAAHERTWRFDAIPWSKTTSEAFAGLHNKGKRVVLLFDEASAIEDAIWEVSEGALTDKDTELIWLAFGNPTRNTGRFYDAFHKLKHRWITRQIDSRSVGITDKAKLGKWAADYGEDSDFFRVRCRGEFPNVGDRQFISTALVEAARKVVLHPASQAGAVGILTLDGAWTGGDEIVCGFRKGLSFKICWVQAKNDNDIDLARRLATTEDEEKADAVFIDQGYGTGVYSYGKEMHRSWTLIPFGGAAGKKDTYKNKRAEMYGDGRQWLRNGGQLPDDPALAEQICAPEQVFRDDGLIQLEAKEDIIERIGYSPGRSDAWALSFALPVRHKEIDIPLLTKSGPQHWHPHQSLDQEAGDIERRIPL